MDITYEEFIEKTRLISEKEAMDHYDDLWIRINQHIASYNYQAQLKNKEKMRKFTDLIDCLSEYNDWAKKDKWSPELFDFMINRIESDLSYVIADRDWMSHIVFGRGPMNEIEFIENYDEINSELHIQFLKRGKARAQEGRYDLIEWYSGSPIDYLSYNNDWAKRSNWSRDLDNFLGRKGITR
jgi:hypothetical protein